MTAIKPRHPVTWAGAVTRVMGALGLAAGQAIGKSDSLIRKFADPDHDAVPNLDQAVALDAAYQRATGEEPPILRVYLQRLDEATRDIPHRAIAPHARMLKVMTEAGEVAKDLHEALEDGAMTPHEKLLIQKDIADTVEQLNAMVRDLDQLASGKVSARPAPNNGGSA